MKYSKIFIVVAFFLLIIEVKTNESNGKAGDNGQGNAYAYAIGPNNIQGNKNGNAYAYGKGNGQGQGQLTTPRPPICDLKGNITADNGEFIKAACVIFERGILQDIQNLCQSYGGRVYAIETEADYKGLANYMVSIAGIGSNADFLYGGIDGRFDGTNWYLTDRERKPKLIWDGAVPTRRLYGVAPAAGDVLRITNIPDTRAGADENTAYFCEFPEYPDF